MPISKYAQNYMKKEGSFGIACGMHLAQNATMRLLMEHPEKTKYFFQKLVAHAIKHPGSPMPTALGSAKYGIGRGLIPELTILHDHIGHLSKQFEKNLAHHSVDIHNLENRDLVAIRRLMRGDIKGAFNANSPNAKKLVTSFIKTISSNSHKSQKILDTEKIIENLGNGTIPQESINALLSGIEDTIKKNPVTGPLQNVYKNKKVMKDVDKFVTDSYNAGATSALADPITDKATRVGLAVLDPITAGVNETKRLMAWEGARKSKIMAKAQDTLNNIFVKNPVENQFANGLSGKNYSGKIFKQNLLNPISSAASEFLNGIGLAFHNAKINPNELLGVVKEKPINTPRPAIPKDMMFI